MKKKYIWIGISIAVLCIIGYKATIGKPAVAVEASRTIRGDIEEYVEETGNLVLEKERVIYSLSDGRILRIPKKEGEPVKAGEILATIDDKDIQLQIEALEAQKLAASAKYEEIKASADEEELRMLASQVRSAEAAYEEAKRTMDNNRVLYEAGAVSLDVYKGSITALAAAEAALESAKSNLALAEKGASENVKKQYAAQIAELQARVDQLQLKMRETVIKSPIDGIILSRDVEEGNIVQTGARLFEVGDSEGMYIECDVLIEDVAGVRIGADVLIEDEDLGIKAVQGTVRKIYPKARSVMSELGIEQNRIKVEIDLNQAVPKLRPGYDVTVKIITESSKNTLLIPEKAVFSFQGKDHVFVNEDGIAKLRAIEKGLESDEMVEVLKGLKEGEEVILSPDKNLEEGTKVKASL